jgi:tRNA(Ile)-lysidine synthase
MLEKRRKTSKYSIFSYRFLKVVHTFVEQLQLFKKQDSLCIALSGGVDSIVLAYCLKQLGFKLRAIHIHHGTRKTQDRELKFVTKFCKQHQIPLEVTHLSHLKGVSNFEASARKARYDVLLNHLQTNEFLILAHHLDDSFEWTLMQNFKSSRLESSLGIPVVNGKIRRPLMCVSKKQIIRFARQEQLSFCEDPTNNEEYYERNFVRKRIKVFAQKYPSYLKHYVVRQNELARLLGKHLKASQNCSYQIKFFPQGVLIFALADANNRSGLENLINEGVKYLSPTSRGKLREQINKMVKAMDNFKRGPMTLVSGIKAYLSYESILLTHRESVTVDEERKAVLLTYNDLLQNTQHDPAYFVDISDDPIWLKKISYQYSFLNYQAKGKVISVFDLLRLWKKQKNKTTQLKMKLLRLNL